jgi:hypothetical protein
MYEIFLIQAHLASPDISKDMTEVDSSVDFRFEIYQMHEPILRK